MASIVKFKAKPLNERRPIEALPNEYLECRDMGHAWEHDTDGDIVKSRGVITFTRIMLCPRCATHRIETLHIFGNGQVEKSRVRYTYPEGYRLLIGQGKRANVWYEVARRSGYLEVAE